MLGLLTSSLGEAASAFGRRDHLAEADVFGVRSNACARGEAVLKRRDRAVLYAPDRRGVRADKLRAVSGRPAWRSRDAAPGRPCSPRRDSSRPRSMRPSTCFPTST